MQSPLRIENTAGEQRSDHPDGMSWRLKVKTKEGWKWVPHSGCRVKAEAVELRGQLMHLADWSVPIEDWTRKSRHRVAMFLYHLFKRSKED